LPGAAVSDGGTPYVVPNLVQFVPCHAGRSSDCDLIATSFVGGEISTVPKNRLRSYCVDA